MPFVYLASGVKAMKSQAWGWLATAVLAAGLNSSYHNGGLQWIHEAADRVQHNTNAVLALATGRADQFLAEAQLASAQSSSSCPFRAALAAVRHSIAPVHAQQERLEAMTPRQEEALARLEANRARIETQFVRLNMANFNPVMVRAPKVVCTRVHVSIPRIPAMRLPAVKMPAAPVVQIEYSGAGPV
jgi:hypothetical protein